MADKLSNMLLDALARAALAPGGTPLIGTKADLGLFAATAAARQAAQRALDGGLLHKVTAGPKGKPDRDLYAATDAGHAFLLSRTSAKHVLEDLARAVEGRSGQIEDLLGVARETQTELAAIKGILARLGEPGAATRVPSSERPPVADGRSSLEWLVDLRQHLSDWDANGTAGDCPLPDLFNRLQPAHPGITIGRFHDGLRELHDREQVYLHPWTGPLYALPEPAAALLVGHEIAYYASLRSGQRSAVNGQPASADDRRPTDYRLTEEALAAVSG